MRRGAASWWIPLMVALLAVSGCFGEQDAEEDATPDPDVPALPGLRVIVAEPSITDAVCMGVVRGIDLQNATVKDLRDAMAAGRLSSLDLVDAYLERIAALDAAGPAVNSVREINPQARQQAMALDGERMAGTVRGPLHGIPVLLKDNVGTMDQHTTAGSIALADNVPPADAELVERLRAAGAVILGKANLSEFANWVSLTMPNGYSSLGGQVVNAYTGGDPSGSSSGSGVAGSMAFAQLTIGTETSGSILSPANANSLVGLKPTTGFVSRAGIIPLAHNFDTPGPMVRHVADAAAMMSAMAGTDPADPRTADADANLPPGGDFMALLDQDALAGVRLGHHPSNNALFGDALAVLEAQGAELVPIESHPLQPVSILEIGLIFNEFKFGINRYLAEEAGPGLPVSDLTGIILYNQDHPDEVRYGQDLLILSDATPGVGPLADATAVPVIAAARLVADDLFASNDVDAIVYTGGSYISLGAAAGYPTVTVPSGYNGFSPQGLSFFGPAWSDGQLLAFAYAYEQASLMRQAPALVNDGLLDGVCPAA